MGITCRLFDGSSRDYRMYIPIVPRYRVRPHCHYRQSLDREVRRYWSKWGLHVVFFMERVEII